MVTKKHYRENIIADDPDEVSEINQPKLTTQLQIQPSSSNMIIAHYSQKIQSCIETYISKPLSISKSQKVKRF